MASGRRRALIDIERSSDDRSAFKLSLGYSNTPGETPVPGDFTTDCLAIINTADRILYFLDATGNVFSHTMEGSLVANTYSDSDLGVTTTTSTTFQTKLTMSENFDAGLYAVIVSYGWNFNDTTSDFEARTMLDSVQQGEIHKQEPQDSGGTFGSTGTDQRNFLTRTHLFSLSGNQTIEIEFRSANGANASMFDAHIVAINLTGLA